jgi:hypothetical protein
LFGKSNVNCGKILAPAFRYLGDHTHTHTHTHTEGKPHNIKANFVTVYVDFQPGDIPIKVIVQIGQTSQSSMNRKWNIQITQIECTSTARGWYFEKEWKCVTTVMWN